ncbi:MAG: patatin-like phospholipase family protein [Pseudomonadota bacterium]
MRRTLTFITLLFITACSSTPKTPNIINLPTEGTPPSKPATLTQGQRQPVIALALGGGGAKGFAHIGAIKVLESHNIRPNIVVGTSAGSFVGSLYASGMSPYAMQLIAENFQEKDIRDLTLSTQGFIDGKTLQSYVNKLVNNTPIQRFPKRFAAVATRLDTGAKAVFNRGNTGQAVRASCSIPNIFVPAVINGIKYVDGGLVSPVPASVARDLGADIVIAIDISARPKSEDLGLLGLLDQTINIMSQQAIKSELAQADIVIKPRVLQFGTLDINKKHTAILEGERAAQQQISAIQHAVEKFLSSKAAFQPAPRPKLK